MSIQHTVNELMLARKGRTAREDLTAKSFQIWNHSFIFDAIKNQRYGQAFCNHFGITDNILYYEQDITRAQKHITKYYLPK